MSNGLTDSNSQRQRLKDDFAFYARNCLKIRTKNEGLQPFILNSAQRYIDKMFLPLSPSLNVAILLP